MESRSNKRSLFTDHDINNILTCQFLTDITEHNWRRFNSFFVRSVHSMNRKLLVMTQCVDCIFCKESSTVDRAMVDNLDQSIIFILNRRVEDADQAVCRAGKEPIRKSWVELQFCYVVVVRFDRLPSRFRSTCIPDKRQLSTCVISRNRIQWRRLPYRYDCLRLYKFSSARYVIRPATSQRSHRPMLFYRSISLPFL